MPGRDALAVLGSLARPWIGPGCYVLEIRLAGASGDRSVPEGLEIEFDLPGSASRPRRLGVALEPSAGTSVHLVSFTISPVEALSGGLAIQVYGPASCQGRLEAIDLRLAHRGIALFESTRLATMTIRLKAGAPPISLPQRRMPHDRPSNRILYPPGPGPRNLTPLKLRPAAGPAAPPGTLPTRPGDPQFPADWTVDLTESEGWKFAGPYVDLAPGTYWAEWNLHFEEIQNADLPLTIADVVADSGRRQLAGPIEVLLKDLWALDDRTFLVGLPFRVAPWYRPAAAAEFRLNHRRNCRLQLIEFNLITQRRAPSPPLRQTRLFGGSLSCQPGPAPRQILTASFETEQSGDHALQFVFRRQEHSEDARIRLEVSSPDGPFPTISTILRPEITADDPDRPGAMAARVELGRIVRGRTIELVLRHSGGPCTLETVDLRMASASQGWRRFGNLMTIDSQDLSAASAEVHRVQLGRDSPLKPQLRFASTSQVLKIRDGGKERRPPELTITLPIAGPLSGRVLHAGGHPVIDAAPGSFSTDRALMPASDDSWLGADALRVQLDAGSGVELHRDQPIALAITPSSGGAGELFFEVQFDKIAHPALPVLSLTLPDVMAGGQAFRVRPRLTDLRRYGARCFFRLPLLNGSEAMRAELRAEAAMASIVLTGLSLSRAQPSGEFLMRACFTPTGSVAWTGDAYEAPSRAAVPSAFEGSLTAAILPLKAGKRRLIIHLRIADLDDAGSPLLRVRVEEADKVVVEQVAGVKDLLRIGVDYTLYVSIPALHDGARLLSVSIVPLGHARLRILGVGADSPIAVPNSP